MRARFQRPAGLLLAIAALAAASRARAGEPSGEPSASGLDDNFDTRWVTVSTDHFVVYASGGVRVARRAAEEAERDLQALRVALSINGDFPDDRRPVTLVIFTSNGLYNLVASPRTGGEFRPALRWGETDVALVRGVGRFQFLRHELVHRLMHPVLPKAPPWLDEGMAQYFQWTRMTDTTVVAGSTPETAELQRKLHDSPWFPPLAQLLATPRATFYGKQAAGLYNASFWLISALNSNDGYRQRLNQVIRAISRGLPPDLAWERAFTPAETEVIDREYRALPQRPDPVSHQLPWTPAALFIADPRPLDRAETHVLLGRLYAQSRPSLAREELDAAVELDPRNAEALALRSLFEPGRSMLKRDDAERAVALDSAAPLGWQALGLSLLPPARAAERNRLREVVRRLESFGTSAESQCLAAVLVDNLGDRAQALKLARAAVRVSPNYFRGYVVLAKLAAASHAQREARDARERAWALAPDGFDPVELELLLGDAGKTAAR
jgi:tetratricopeptide (TPR) repeat protein